MLNRVFTASSRWLPVCLRRDFRRQASSVALIGILSGIGFMAGGLLPVPLVRADDEISVTVVTGTAAGDAMTIADPIDAQAGLLTDESEKIAASATALDAQAGNDTIFSESAVAAHSDATALLLQILDAKTQALAKSLGLLAGDGDDMVTSSGSVTVDAVSDGAYAGGLLFDIGDRDDEDRKIDISLSTEAGSTAIDTGDGDDTVDNEAILDADAVAISGGTADQLTAELEDSLSLTAQSSAKAETTGISSGDGDDNINNSSTISSVATATSGALGLDLSAGENAEGDKAKLELDVSAKAEAMAIGIQSDGDDPAEEDKDASPFGLDGLRVTYTKETTAESGSDDIVNRADIESVATATSGAGAASIDIGVDGAVQIKANAEAKAESIGIAAGAAGDSIFNNGHLSATATATVGALSASFQVGEASTDGDTSSENNTSSQSDAKATARAVGIAADGEGQFKSVSASAEISDTALVSHYAQTEGTLSAADQLTNEGAITTVATATSGSAGAAIDIMAGGSMASQANAEATSEAVAIFTGGGDDTVSNTGALDAVATSTADAISVGLAAAESQDDDSGDDADESGSVKSESGSKATATAKGIDTEGEAQSKSLEVDLAISRSGITAGFEYRREAASGSDTVDNQGTISAVSTATSGSGSAAIDIMAGGSVESKANAEANAESVAIFTGGGDDTVTNTETGELDAVATASAGAVGVTVGVSDSSDQDDDGGIINNLRERFWPTVHSEANATATATATGIDAEGTAEDTSFAVDGSLDRQGLALNLAYGESQASGNDRVENDGAITAVATATSGAGSVDVQVNSDGTAAAEANSTATARADAIRTGSGDDRVDNEGALSAVATATAGALSVGVAHAEGDDTKARVEAKATSTAKANGIDTEGDSDSRAVVFDLGLSREGLHVHYNDTRTAASGNDVVVNQAGVTAVATASSGAAAVPVSIDGSAAADVTSKATSGAAAISTGGGRDVIDNNGDLAATSTATSAALAVAFGQQTQSTGKTKASVKAGATATADAVGIAADGDSGDQSTDFALDLTEAGLGSRFAKTRTAVDGDDTLTNTGDVTTTATASSGAAGVAVAIDGAAAVDITSTTKAHATGIDTGGGNDTIDNQGAITSTATATSLALGVGVGAKSGSSGKASSKVEATAKSEARAIGITTDGDQQDTALEIGLAITENGLGARYYQSKTPVSGDDHLTNTEAVTAVATATSGAGAVGVTTEGSAKSDAGAEAKADARALDLGGGSDTVDNSGALSAVATATAAAVEVSVSGKGTTIANNGIFSAGTKADARSVGIAGTGAENAETLDVTLGVDFNAVSAEFGFEKIADGIGADGNDTVINNAAITAVATATAPEVSVAVTSEGIAASLTGTEAKADAAAIRTGHGDDVIMTDGSLSAVATATAAAANVAVTGKGLAVAGNAVWDGGIKADAKAAGIHSEGGDKDSLTVDVGASLQGVAVVYGKTKELASGEDTVTNDGDITATAVAAAPEVSVAVASQGMAASISTSTANSEAFGIRTGDADDTITNRGSITATANADAVAVNVAVAPTGVSAAGNNFWSGGNKAQASAFGIDADGETASETRSYFGADNDGVAFTYTQEESLANGDDVIRNDGDVTVTAVAAAPTASVAVTTEGVAAAMSTATAKSDARAIRGGDGDDDIENAGDLTVFSNADAAAVNVSVVPTGGVSVAGNNFWDGGTQAEALAVGIDGDGESLSTSSTNVSVGGNGIGIEYTSSRQMASGDDRIVNSGNMDITAVAVSPAVSAAVTAAGVSAAISTAKATSDARAIRGGDGSDTIENTGDLTVVSNADAAAVNVSVNAEGGVALAADAIWDGGTTAEARAMGIDAEGESSTSSTTKIAIGASVDYDRDKTDEEATGDDIVNNQGAINAWAVAVAPSVAVSVVGTGGVAGAISTATAKADSTAISTGGGDDTIRNSGALTSGTVANADAVSVSVTGVGGVSVSGNNVWDGGTKSEATTRGVDSGDGDDVLENHGAIAATATSVTANGSVSVTGVGGVAGAISTSTAKSDSAAILTGEGADTIQNFRSLSSGASSIAASVNVSVTGVGGVSVSGNNAWDGGTRAEAKSRGVDSGDGDDTLENSGDIAAWATTVAASGAVSVVGVGGGAGALSTATAKADSAAIDTGSGEDTITNTGMLSSEAFATGDAANVSVTGVGGVSVSGNDVWDGGTLSEAQSRGLTSGDGDDHVDNYGAISATATTVTGTGAVAVTGVGGVSGAISTATAKSDGTAIDTGDGDDEVTNSGNLTAESSAVAAAVNVSVTGVGGVSIAGNNAWDGGTLSEARSRGIDSGDGDDTLDNSGDIVATATTVTATGAVSVTGVGGVSGAVSTSTAKSDAVAIAMGAGEDEVANSGVLDARAFANADGLNVAVTGVGGVSVAGNNAWDGGTLAEARAAGIDGGDGEARISNTNRITATADAVSVAASLSYVTFGVPLAISTSTADADAAALRSGDEDDELANSGDLTAAADATAVSVNVAVTGAGVAGAGDAVWDGGTKATAVSVGVDAQAGQDMIHNNGAMAVDADAVTSSTSVAFTVAGVSGAISTSTATADAQAISAGDGDDTLVNEGALDSTANATAVSVSFAASAGGAAIAADAAWDGGTKANASSQGLAGGLGNDEIRNTAGIDATADSTASSNSVAMTVAGVSGAVSTATSIADAAAIDAGEGNDTILNSGDLTGTADAGATSVSVTITGMGAALATDAFWDGGTQADATARGIAGGAGADEITNTANITAEAGSHTTSAAVSVVGGGLAGAMAASTASAAATAIDAGADDDRVYNDGELTATAAAEASGVSVAVTSVGASLAGALDSATTGNARAVGMAGGEGADFLTSSELSAMTIDARAVTTDTAVSVAAEGLAGAVADALAVAEGIAIDGGADNDQIANAGLIVETVAAEANSRAVAFTLTGVEVVDANAESRATATGLSGGAGDDVVRNFGSIALEANADAEGLAIGGTLGGASVAGANATAGVEAIGLEGEGGEDTLINTGRIAGDVNATTHARTINAALAGYALSEANATATVSALGISGGESDDILINTVSGDIDLLATADVYANQVTIAVAGAADGEANATPEIEVTGLAGGAGDDAILNEGRLTLRSRSKSEATGSSWTVAGSASSRSGNQVTTTVKGITGGSGNDDIVNTGTIQVGPGEDATGDDYWMASLITDSYSLGFAGATNAETTAYAHTLSTGIEGETGEDRIQNDGDILVMATSRSESTSGTLNLFGSGAADSDAGALTVATGIMGGEGDDRIVTGGASPALIRVIADSNLTMDGSRFAIGGGGAAGGKLAAETVAAGISGGDGEDLLINAGDVSVTAVSTLNSQAGSDTIFGTSGTGLTSGATTDAAGMTGGDGDDAIENTGRIEVAATATLTQDGSSYTFGGTGETGGALVAATRVVGIAGDLGGDIIRNAGDIIVAADADLESRGDSETTFGTSEGGVTVGADVEGAGIDSGDGDDAIETTGRIEVSAAATLNQAGSSYTFGGTGETGGTLAATTRTVGIVGDGGADHIRNTGVIDVQADAALTSNGASEATFGGSSASVVSGGQSYAAGITGGEDDDVIENNADGRVDVRSSAEVTTESIAYTFGGGSGTEAILTGDATAVGLDGGSGNDRLASHGVVDVEAVSTLQSTGGAKNTLSLTSDVDSTGRSAAAAQARGLDAGDGDDIIAASGQIDVRAAATTEVLNEARSGASITSDNEAGAITRADADAAGLAAGDGANRIHNQSELTVAAASTAYAFAYASGASVSFDGDGLTRAESRANATAAGIRAADGDNVIANTGQVTVTADATTAKELETSITIYSMGDDAEPIDPPQTYGEEELPAFVDGEGDPIDQNRTGYPEGTILFWTRAPLDQQDPNVAAQGAYYVVVVSEIDPDGPDGEEEPYELWQWELTQQVVAETITIAEDSFPSYAAANGNGLDGDGNARATGSTVAEARGVQLGDGDNVVDNRGDIVVQASAETRLHVSSDGDAFGDAIGTSEAQAVARAYGLDMGNGDNRVYNAGTIDVAANPVAESLTDVSGGDICIWFFGWWCGGGGDGIGTSNASAWAEALGINLGDGDNIVVNDGTIVARAAPEITTAVNAGADTATVIGAVQAHAVGIRTGDGDNVIVNNGIIEAHAVSTSIPCINCPDPAPAEAPIQAVGIQTGAGDDTIVNSGRIATSITVAGLSSDGVAIATGAGNDQVALLAGSETTGRVALGEGDDRLNLVGSALLEGDALGGAGRDDIVFHGEGRYDGAIEGFEGAAKHEAGTYTLNSLPTMQTLQIYDGTLRVEDDYVFDETGSALMRIHLNGFGQLAADGTADLGGDLAVLAEQRMFHNGQIFPIIQSQSLADTFQDVDLPEARQLLRFELNYNNEDEQVEVVARTRSFRTVARNANERAIADYLDRIGTYASGELSRVLGEFQTLQGRQFGEAFAGMSPASYGASTGAALNTSRLYSQVIGNRMQSLGAGPSGSSSPEGRCIRIRSGRHPAGLQRPERLPGRSDQPPGPDRRPAALGRLGQCLRPMGEPGWRRRFRGLRQRHLRRRFRNGLRPFGKLVGRSQFRLFQQRPDVRCRHRRQHDQQLFRVPLYRLVCRWPLPGVHSHLRPPGVRQQTQHSGGRHAIHGPQRPRWKSF